MKLRNLLLLVLWGSLSLLSLVLVNELITTQKSEYLKGVDSKLYTAALMAKASLPEDYHDKLINSTSITTNNYLKSIDRYNKLCLDLDLQYLWSVMVVDEDIVFTSSTSTSKDINNGDHALFFDIHNDPASFDGVLSANKASFSSFHNEWGNGRMVLIPFVDNQGRTYIFGASISIDALNTTLTKTKQRIFTLLAAVLLISSIVAIASSQILSNQILRLTTITKSIANGNYGEHTHLKKGLHEIKSLSKYIDAMSDAIAERDQTSQHEIQRQTQNVRNQEEDLRSIIETAAEGIITINGRGNIGTFNPAAERIFGYTAQEIIGKNVNTLMPKQEQKKHDNYIESSNLFGSKIINQSRELIARHKTGRLFPLELNVGRMQGSSHQRFVGTMRDVSNQVKTLKELKEAKITSERANKAKSNFLSSMSHELRTPLNAILGFGQVLQIDTKNPLNEKQSINLKYLLEGGEHLLSLIDDILDLSIIESDTFELACKPVSVFEIFEECITMTQTLATQYKVNLSINTGDWHYVYADHKRLKQIMINLISNAIKYNSKQGHVFLECKKIQNSQVILSVHDDGPGLTDEEQSELFTPFNRLGAEASNIPGTGIGLPITKALVEKMQGKIEVKSSKGNGSVFSIYLPLSKNRPQPLDSANAPPKEVRIKGTVLYIEDNHINMRLMESVFSTQDATLLTAKNAEEGLALFQSELPDLILMDINLPGLSGSEALQKIRGMKGIGRTPVIAITAAAMSDDKKKGKEAGFDAYMTKPFNIHKLLSTIEELIK